MELQIICENKENIPEIPYTKPSLSQSRVLSPRNSFDSKILPEKPRLTSNDEKPIKETSYDRHSLSKDTKTRELYTEDSQDSTRSTRGHKELSVDNQSSAQDEVSPSSKDNVTENQTTPLDSASSELRHRGDSKYDNLQPSSKLDHDVSEVSSKRDERSTVLSEHVSVAKDKDKQYSTSIAEDIPDEDTDEVSKSSIGEELSSASKSVSSKASLKSEASVIRSERHSVVGSELNVSELKSASIDEDIYDDDFFETGTSKVSAYESALQEVGGSKYSQSVGRRSYEDDFETTETADEKLSVKYSVARDELASESISEKSNNISNHSTQRSQRLKSDNSESDNQDSRHSLSEKSSDLTSGRSSRKLSSKSNKVGEVARNDKSAPSSKSSSILEDLISASLSQKSVSNKFQNDRSRSQPDHSAASNQEKDATPLSENKSSSRRSVKSSSKTSTISSEIVQPDAFSKSDVSYVEGFRVGDRVMVEDTMMGTIRYLGKTPFSPVLVAGIELDQALGTNDGYFQGKRYFKCPEDFGLFTTLNRLFVVNETSKKSQKSSRSKREISVGKNLSIDDKLEDLLDKASESSTIEEIEESLREIEESLSQHSLRSHLSASQASLESRRHDSQPSAHISQHSASKHSKGEISKNNEDLEYSEDFEGSISQKSTSINSSKVGEERSLSNKSSQKTISKSSQKTISKSSAASLKSVSEDAPIDEQISAKEPVKYEIEASNDSVIKEEDLEQTRASESESDFEVPSPAKVNVGSIADSITDSLMKQLLSEFKSSGAEKNKDEVPEAYTTALSSNLDSILPPKNRDGNSLVSDLVSDAISSLLTVRKDKISRIELDGAITDLQKSSTGQNEIEGPFGKPNNFLSLIVDDDPDAGLQSPPRLLEDALDSNLLTEKLNKLKTFHDELDVLLGDPEDEDDRQEPGDEKENDKLDLVGIETPILRPPVGFDRDEPILRIPFSEQLTSELLKDACEEVFDYYERVGTVVGAKPSQAYVDRNQESGMFDQSCTKLYQELVFDVARELISEVHEFREYLSEKHPPWMKPPKKTYSKFVRQAHLLSKDELISAVDSYVSTCIGLNDGRPDLEKYKRKLPLNVSKKDYVDAVLIEELREEEPLWVNYDDDELKVKVQLTDSIMDSLIDEVVDIIKLAQLDGPENLPSDIV